MGSQYAIERIVMGSLSIGGIVDASIDPGIAYALQSGSSAIDPHHLAVTDVVPVLECTTMDIKTFMDAAVAVSTVIPHIPIAAGTPLYAYLAQRSDGGTYTGGSSNQRIKITKGIIYPRYIRSNGQIAVIGIAICIDGLSAANALQIETGQALPAGSGGPANQWRVAAIINDADGSNTIRRVLGFDINFGISVGSVRTASRVDPSDCTVQGFAPTASFTTEAVKSVIDWTGATRAVATGDGFRLVLAKYTAGGIGIASSNGISFDFLAGSLIVPRTIGLGAGPVAIACDVIGVGGGTYEAASTPLEYSTGVTPPIDSTDAADAQRYMVGPLYENTTLLTEMVGGSFDFGVNVETVGPASLPWPTKAHVTRRTPMLRRNGVNGDYYQSLHSTLGRVTSGTTRQFLRKMTANGHGIADATTSHIKLQMAAAAYVQPGAASGADGGHFGHEVIFTKADNSALATSTGSAIS